MRSPDLVRYPIASRLSSIDFSIDNNVCGWGLRRLLASVGFFLEASAPEQNGDDNRCSHQSRYGIDGQSPLKPRHTSNDIAEKSQSTSNQTGSRHQDPMIRCVKDNPCQVWHSHPQKADGTAIGRDGSDEQTGGRDHEQPCPTSIQSQITCVAFSQQ